MAGGLFGTKADLACRPIENTLGTRLTLAERWNGACWFIQPTPNPVGAASAELLGVSCTSADACTAVGDDTYSAGRQLTLAEWWNGAGWSIRPTPSPAGAPLRPVDPTAVYPSADIGVNFGVSCAPSRT